ERKCTGLLRDSVVWRSVDRKERIAQTVWPWTVVNDDEDETVLYIPAGTVGKWRTGERGGPGDRFIVRWDGGHADITWKRTNVVRLYRSGDPYSLLARVRGPDMGSGVAIHQPQGPVASHPDRVRFSGPLPRSRRRTRRPRLAVEGRGRTCVGRRAGSPRRGTRRRDPRRWRAGDQGRPRDGIARRMENVAAGSALAHSDRSRPVAQVRPPRER